MAGDADGLYLPPHDNAYISARVSGIYSPLSWGSRSEVRADCMQSSTARPVSIVQTSPDCSFRTIWTTLVLSSNLGREGKNMAAIDGRRIPEAWEHIRITCKPENVKAILATQFADFGL